MRHAARACSMLAVVFVAVAGSGCDQILSALQDAERQHGGAATGTAGAPGSMGAGGKEGVGGSSGASSGNCIAVMGATGVCKRCYDATGLLIFEDCPPPAPDAATCLSIDDGGPSSCKDPATWQQYGAERCKEQNLVLTSVTPTGKCDQGYSTVTYTCCGGAPDAGTPPPPPKCGQTTGVDGQLCKTCWDATGLVISNDCIPAPTATDASTGTGGCVEIDDGSPSSCKDEGTWKTYGTDRCAEQNLTLTQLKLVTTCGTGVYSTVAYLCCGAGL